METKRPRLRCDYYNADGTAYDLTPCRSIAGGWHCKYAHPDDPDWASSQQTWKAQRRRPDEQHRPRPPSPPLPSAPSDTPSMTPAVTDPRKRPPISANTQQQQQQPQTASNATSTPIITPAPPPPTPVTEEETVIDTSDPLQLLAQYQEYTSECMDLETKLRQYKKIAQIPGLRLTPEVKKSQEDRFVSLKSKLDKVSSLRDSVRKVIIELDAWPAPLESQAEQDLAATMLHIRQETEELQKGIVDSSSAASAALQQHTKLQERIALGKRRREAADEGSRNASLISETMSQLDKLEDKIGEVEEEKDYHTKELKEALNDMIAHTQQKIRSFNSSSMSENQTQAVDNRLSNLQARIDGFQEKHNTISTEQNLIEETNESLKPVNDETHSEWNSLLEDLRQLGPAWEDNAVDRIAQSLHEYTTHPHTTPHSPLPPSLLFAPHEYPVREAVQNKIRADLESLRATVEPMLGSHQNEIQKSVVEKIDLTRRTVDMIVARVQTGAAGIIQPQ